MADNYVAPVLKSAEAKQVTGDEYTMWLDVIAGALHIIPQAPVEALRAYLSEAETLGPVLDPTAWRDGGDRRLADQRDLLDAVANVQAALTRIKRRNGIGE